MNNLNDVTITYRSWWEIHGKGISEMVVWKRHCCQWKKKTSCVHLSSPWFFLGEGADVCEHRLKQTWNTCSQSIKDLQFRIFDNPPVIDIFEAIASDLLLCWAATSIRVLDRVGVCVRMEPALLAKGVSQGDLRTICYLWCHKIKVQISISMI